MSKNIKSLLILLALFLISNIDVFAGGPPGPGNGPPGGGCWPPSSCVPIDGGIGFLIAAGVAYGVKMVNDISKKKAE